MTFRARMPAFCLGLTLMCSASLGQASDCPDFGQITKEKADTFCAEFLDLLYAPLRTGEDRGSAAAPRQDVEDLIGANPLWSEVYRADPGRTLKLINRIQDAGGL